MSQWTHVLGAIRFDSSYRMSYPRHRRADELAEWEADHIYEILERSYAPMGSEGGIEYNITMSKRGPVVVLTADLRDFGREDVEGIFDWIRAIASQVKEWADSGNSFLLLRDVNVGIQVEFDPNIYLITDNHDYPHTEAGKIVLHTFQNVWKRGDIDSET